MPPSVHGFLTIATFLALASCDSGGGGGGSPGPGAKPDAIPTMIAATFVGTTSTPSAGDQLQLFLSEDATLVPDLLLTDLDVVLSDGSLGDVTIPPTLKNKRTIVMEVELEPDNDYSLSLNCPAAQNFRSVKGVSLVPTPWRFSTLPASLLPKKLQTKRNRAAFAELKNVLASKYSYYDYRALDWKKLYKKHENAILSSPTELAWASAVGSMLKPVNDIHMYLRSGKNTIVKVR